MFSIQKFGALALCLLSGLAQAQSAAYPNRPIKMVIPYAAGGPMDFIGRTLSPRLAQSLGQPLVIENRAGAGGAIGTDVVAKSAGDGYTLLNTSSSHASLPVVSPSLPYDPIKDFAPITLVANSSASWWQPAPTCPPKT